MESNKTRKFKFGHVTCENVMIQIINFGFKINFAEECVHVLKQRIANSTKSKHIYIGKIIFRCRVQLFNQTTKIGIIKRYFTVCIQIAQEFQRYFYCTFLSRSFAADWGFLVRRVLDSVCHIEISGHLHFGYYDYENNGNNGV